MESGARGTVPPQTPPPHTASQHNDGSCPALVNTQGSAPYYITGAWGQKKKMDQMKEQIKPPEKIQLSGEEIANLSDAHFKTLVIKTLTELVEFV